MDTLKRQLKSVKVMNHPVPRGLSVGEGVLGSVRLREEIDQLYVWQRRALVQAEEEERKDQARAWQKSPRFKTRLETEE